jgi:predicted lysophospholipase L1 biosynthesis ABC-type transport system permease subunit
MEFGFQSSNLISIEDKPSDANSLPIRRGKYISPELFKTQGTTVVAGRDFTWTDIYEQKPIVIVSENMARETWGSASAALGKRVRIGTAGEWSEIVGVVADVYDDGVHQSAPRMLYWRGGVQSFRQAGITTVSRSITFAVRSGRAGTESFLKEIRSVVWSVNPNLPLAQVRTLDDAYRQSMSRTSFTLVMLAIAGSMALVLGIIGIYGVISYSISERIREIGIRLALGSQPRTVKFGFVGEGLLLTCVGLVIGAGAAVPLTRLMPSLLFGIHPLDAVTYVASMVFLFVAALLASYVPARRASSVDPVDALRAE